jgi:hypothetical protein
VVVDGVALGLGFRVGIISVEASYKFFKFLIYDIFLIELFHEPFASRVLLIFEQNLFEIVFSQVKVIARNLNRLILCEFLLLDVAQCFNLILLVLVDEHLLVILDIHQLRHKVCHSHCANQIVQTDLLVQSLLGFEVGLVIITTLSTTFSLLNAAAAENLK